MIKFTKIPLIFLFIGLVFVRYVEALTPNPHYSRVFCKYGKTYQKKGKLDRAILFYKKAIGSDPHLAVAYLVLGEAYFQKMDFEKAQRYFETALTMNHGFDEALNALGIIHQQRGDLNKAIILFESAAMTRPWADSKPAEYRYNLGLAYWESGNIRAALVEADRVEELENKELAQRLRNIISSSE